MFSCANSKHASFMASSMFSKYASMLRCMSTLNTVHERVTHAIEKSGHNASSAARELGCTPEAVLQWMNGTTKNIRPVNLFALADLTGFSARWLATGDGPQIDSYRNATIQHVVQVMEKLPAEEQGKLARMADAFAGPASNDDPPATSSQRDMAG